MTALLELKQRIKNLYSQYEIYILPVLRFVLAMAYFIWLFLLRMSSFYLFPAPALLCA